MATVSFARRIRDIVAEWEGVSVQSNRHGDFAFFMQHRAFGHLHGDHMADLPFPVRVRRDLVAAGRAQPHRTMPGSGWVSHPIRSEHDVPAVVELLRLNYERVRGGTARVRPSQSMGRSVRMLRDHTNGELPT